MNTEKLKDIYSRSNAAKALFDWASKRQNAQTETPVDHLVSQLKKEGIHLSRPELMDLFRKLEEERVGNFLMGRRGMPTRFAWNENMLEVAKQAISAREAAPVAKQQAAPTPTPSAGLLGHSFMLRPGMLIRLEVPADLTAQEAERVALMLRTLAVDFKP